MKARPGSPDYCGHDLSHLFTLRVATGRGSPLVVIHAFDANRFDGSHSRIDVEVRMGGEVVFPRGALYCGMPQHETLDGIAARELVLSLVAMRPGDTDSEYFDSYTPEQLAFAETYGETLSCEREARYCDENGACR